jgi:hypothetical protein
MFESITASAIRFRGKNGTILHILPPRPERPKRRQHTAAFKQEWHTGGETTNRLQTDNPDWIRVSPNVGRRFAGVRGHARSVWKTDREPRRWRMPQSVITLEQSLLIESDLPRKFALARSARQSSHGIELDDCGLFRGNRRRVLYEHCRHWPITRISTATA